MQLLLNNTVVTPDHLAKVAPDHGIDAQDVLALLERSDADPAPGGDGEEARDDLQAAIEGLEIRPAEVA